MQPTDVPFDVFGEGSFDKGIYIDIPLDWPREARVCRNAISQYVPLHDGGARLATGRQLYRMVRDAHEMHVQRELGRIWK